MATVSRNIPTPRSLLWTSLLPWGCLYVMLLTVVLGVAPIGGSSEAREAQVMDTIIREGEWVLPHRNGLVPSKPPLLHWIGAALSIPLGGVSEFSSRLPSLLFAAGTIFLVGFIGFRLACAARAWSCSRVPSIVALLSAAALSLTYGFHHMAGKAMVDMSFTFFATAALAAVISADGELWHRERRLSTGAHVAFWGACAFAVLARGPVGLVLPILLIGVPAVWLFGIRQVVRAFVQPSMGWAFFLLPLVWYLAAFERGGDAFVERQLIFENMKRLTGGEYINSEPWWFYVPSILRTTFPWGVFATLLAFIQLRRGPPVFAGYSNEERRVLFVPLVALLAGMVLFSLASGKRHSYMLPLYSLVAVQFALLMVVTYLSGSTHLAQRVYRAVTRTRLVTVVISFVVLALLCSADVIGDASVPLGAEVRQILSRCAPHVSVVLAVGLLWNLLAAPRSLGAATAALWVGLFTVMSSVTTIGDSVKASLKAFPEMTAVVASYLEGGAPLVVIKHPFDEYFDPILFYLRRHVQLVPSQIEELPCDPSTVYLTKSSWLAEEGNRFPGTVTLLQTISEIGDVRKGDRRRELSLFKCAPVTREAAPGVQTVLFRFKTEFPRNSHHSRCSACS